MVLLLTVSHQYPVFLLCVCAEQLATNQVPWMARKPAGKWGGSAREKDITPVYI